MPDEREWTIKVGVLPVHPMETSPREPVFEVVVPKSTREAAEAEVEHLRTGLRERGFIVGRNPDGVDDTVASALLIVDDFKAEVERLRKGLREYDRATDELRQAAIDYGAGDEVAAAIGHMQVVKRRAALSEEPPVEKSERGEASGRTIYAQLELEPVLDLLLELAREAAEAERHELREALNWIAQEATDLAGGAERIIAHDPPREDGER